MPSSPTEPSRLGGRTYMGHALARGTYPPDWPCRIKIAESFRICKVAFAVSPPPATITQWYHNSAPPIYCLMDTRRAPEPCKVARFL
eukprot:COSAG06_NODE_28503_length_573_cov_0.774262_1_plen_86_part_10